MEENLKKNENKYRDNIIQIKEDYELLKEKYSVEKEFLKEFDDLFSRLMTLYEKEKKYERAASDSISGYLTLIVKLMNQIDIYREYNNK